MVEVDVVGEEVVVDGVFVEEPEGVVVGGFVVPELVAAVDVLVTDVEFLLLFTEELPVAMLVVGILLLVLLLELLLELVVVLEVLVFAAVFFVVVVFWAVTTAEYAGGVVPGLVTVTASAANAVPERVVQVIVKI